MSAERPSCRTRNGLKTAPEIRAEERNSPHAQKPAAKSTGPRSATLAWLQLLQWAALPFQGRREKRLLPREGSLSRKWPRGRSARPEAEGKKRRRGRTWAGEGRMSSDGLRDPSAEALWSFIPQRCSGKGRHSSPRPRHRGERRGPGRSGKGGSGKLRSPLPIVLGSNFGAKRRAEGTPSKVPAGLFCVPREGAGGNRQRGCKENRPFPPLRDLAPSRSASFSPGRGENAARPSRDRFGFSPWLCLFEWRIQPSRPFVGRRRTARSSPECHAKSTDGGSKIASRWEFGVKTSKRGWKGALEALLQPTFFSIPRRPS